MLVSNGRAIRNQTTLWTGTPATWPVGLSGRWSTYGALFREQLWVGVVVRKRALAVARLPLKGYERGADGRSENHPSVPKFH